MLDTLLKLLTVMPLQMALMTISTPAMASGDVELAEALDAVADYRYAAAIPSFRLSAEHGNIQAQHTLGLMLLHGEALYGVEVKANRAEAIAWFSRAAGNGCEVSKFMLAKLKTAESKTR